jgi:hypothetical protein
MALMIVGVIALLIFFMFRSSMDRKNEAKRVYEEDKYGQGQKDVILQEHDTQGPVIAATSHATPHAIAAAAAIKAAVVACGCETRRAARVATPATMPSIAARILYPLDLNSVTPRPSSTSVT